MNNIKHIYIKELDINDNFFDSLREDYSNFNNWFKNKQKDNHMCYTTIENNTITSLLILKIEDENESYNDFLIPFSKSKRLKICTFKVSNNGKGIGEEFINIINEVATINNIKEIYVTIYDKHKSLIKLFKDKGYIEYTKKKNESNKLENVLVKEV